MFHENVNEKIGGVVILILNNKLHVKTVIRNKEEHDKRVNSLRKYNNHQYISNKYQRS